jgi:hypothetical protein
MSYTEDEYIEKAASIINDKDLEPFASFFLQAIKPVAFVSGELAMFFYSPLLLMLDNVGYEFLETFQKRENIDRLLKQIEELSKEKEKEQKRKSENDPDIFDKLQFKIKKLFKR